MQEEIQALYKDNLDTNEGSKGLDNINQEPDARAWYERFPNHVFILEKALCGSKLNPRAWYERISTF